MATPLKIRDAGGNIQELTTAEENYVAYQIGLHLAADSANGIGGLTTNASHTSTGTYTNTFFNEPVGTHPSTSITSGSTVTTLYQNQGTSAAETDSDVEIPLMWVDSASQTGFKQMPDADLNEAVERYLSTIFTNDYPGVFKLGSVSPGPNYSVWLSSVFTDTRTDGTSVAYNIYRRDTYSAPTEIPPMYVRDNGGFDGIQAMTDRQIKYSFGQRAKSRIGASKIGTYQIRSSAAGAPTDPGTWISAGSATDTKQTTSDQSFTTTYVGTYTTVYSRNYTGNYQNTYTGAYNKVYTGTYTSNYASNYTKGFDRPYTTNYSRLYTSNYARFYTGPFYQANFATIYVVEFNFQYATQYLSDYSRAFNQFYQRDYLIQPQYIASYARNIGYVTSYQRNITDVYNSAINYIGVSAYDTVQPGDLVGEVSHKIFYARLYTGLSNSTVNLENLYAKEYTGLGKIDVKSPGVPNTGDNPDNVYLGPPTPIPGIPSPIGSQLYTSVNLVTSNSPMQFAVLYQRSTPYTGPGAFYSGSLRSPTEVYSGRTMNVPAAYQRAYIQTVYVGQNPGTFYIREANYTRVAAPFYARDYTRVVNYSRNFIATIYYARLYDVQYIGNYQRNFTRNYTNRNYIPYLRVYTDSVAYNVSKTVNYQNEFNAPYAGDYVSTYITDYSNEFANTFQNFFNIDYSRAFNINYTSDTNVQYENIFETNYVGNFEGLTIDATDETVETYTLYVRIG